MRYIKLYISLRFFKYILYKSLNMNKLSLIFAFTISIFFFGCTNTKGNQEDSNLVVQTDATEGEENLDEEDAKPEYLTYETFLEKVWDFESNPETWVYKGDTPCVIDFYADWCRPCRMVAPIMDDMAKKYEGKVKIYKIDTEKEKQLASVFRIRSIPAVLFIPKEGKPEMQTGALPKESYIEIINTKLLNEKK